ncbi:MAG: hypothetical protein IID36_02085 [Planctomycetes bacterium]|nr:hypothetical protein [Planctomycetota bacterium]
MSERSAVANRSESITITLPGGWRGRIRADQTRIGGGLIADSSDGLAAWRTFLTQLVEDSAGLPDREAYKVSASFDVVRSTVALPNARIAVMCKGSRTRGLIRRIGQLFAPSREERNWARAEMLIGAGVGTALPLAVVQRFGSRPRGWLVSEYIADIVDLDRVAMTLLDKIAPDRVRAVKAALVEQVAGSFARLTNRGIWHRDLKASNILLTDWDVTKAECRVLIVDLDGIRRRPRGRRGRWQPIVRLAASLLEYPSIRPSDHCRFLRSYLAGTGGHAVDWKRDWPRLRTAALKYVRDARQRKRGKFEGFTGTTS